MTDKDAFLSHEPRVAVDFIASWEGFSGTAYLCPAGVWTIGYGHTEGTKEGDIIGKSMARELLVDDIRTAAEAIAPVINVPVTYGQYIALVSLAFNVGANYVKRHCPKLLRALNAGDEAEAARQFLDITRCNGRVLAGLVSRRKAEAELFFPGVTK
ncbi:MAG: lysozyme [Duodenibacillus sp.]